MAILLICVSPSYKISCLSDHWPVYQQMYSLWNKLVQWAISLTPRSVDFITRHMCGIYLYQFDVFLFDTKLSRLKMLILKTFTAVGLDLVNAGLRNSLVQKSNAHPMSLPGIFFPEVLKFNGNKLTYNSPRLIVCSHCLYTEMI